MAAIGLVMLLLAAVLTRIEFLVQERQERQQQAAASVARSLAEPQTLLGPLLHRRCSESWDVKDGVERREFTLSAAPQTLHGSGDLLSEARYRGLFKVNGYAGRVVLQAAWPSLASLQPQRQRAGSKLECAPATLLLALSDVRGVRSAQLELDGAALPVQPGTGHAVYRHGLHAELAEARLADTRPLAAKLTLELVGTGRFEAVPAAAETTWSLRSDWPHPSFGGRFLPLKRDVDGAGFVGHWAVSALASSAAADVVNGVPACAPASGPDDDEPGAAAPRVPAKSACLDTLAVAFIDPVNTYVMTDRATKYAMLFIALTFASVGAVEIVARRRVHPVQYALVGLALALFFLLLLSVSEHVDFGAAYAAASAACVALLGFYGRHMLGGWRPGAAFGAGIALLYGALWVLLRLEQASLVIGSLLLFAMLAAVMTLTRRVDWYTLAGRAAAAQPASP
jgi:inner membrane protein